MGPSKDKFKDFAIAFHRTAKDDLKRIGNAIKNKDHSDAVFHAQQCCEKITKAALEMEEIFLRDHDVSDLFVTYVLKNADEGMKKDLYLVLEILDWFKGAWQLPRYPRLERGRVTIPSEGYTRSQSAKALENATFVFKTLTKLLKEKYGLKVEE